MKILFLIKNNTSYGFIGPKSGLLDSANLTAIQLTKYFGVETKVVICVDGNSIDKEIFLFKPDICIIEALWVTPLKLTEVQKLHSKVLFYVRVHSEIPFLATEGIAVQWLKQYINIKNVFVSFNSEVTTQDFIRVVESSTYLPNLYGYLSISSNKFVPEDVRLFHKKKKYIDIASFGALRPLKDQLIQAYAAIEYGNSNNIPVHFHINSGRAEQGGQTVLKNIQALFDGTHHTLIEHGWLSRGDFLELISLMDIGLQVSFSESFNLVSADFVATSIPIIVSNAVRWMPKKSKVISDVSAISEKINHVLHFSDHYIHSAKVALNNYTVAALQVWGKFLNL